MLYTDFSKAFDKVNHSILLRRLSNYGFSDRFVVWFQTYLRGRSQYVKINNVTSDSKVVPSGVPQGSHFGPMLFLIFIDPLSRLLKNCNCILYADDAKYLRTINSIDDFNSFQCDINLMSSWCVANKLELNQAKCKIISFARTNTILFNYKLFNCEIIRSNHIVDLGVILDQKMTFHLHIDNVVNKSTQRLGLIKRFAIEFCDIFISKCLYVGLVRPLLESSSLIWSPLFVRDVSRIESIQKQFLLFMLRHMNWSDPFILPPYTSRLNLVQLDTLENRRRMLNAMWILKILLGIVECPFILSRLSIVVPRRRLRSNIFIKTKNDHRNFINNQPLYSAVNDYNLVHSVIDFNLSVESNKKNVCYFLRSL